MMTYAERTKRLLEADLLTDKMIANAVKLGFLQEADVPERMKEKRDTERAVRKRARDAKINNIAFVNKKNPSAKGIADQLALLTDQMNALISILLDDITD